MGRCAWGPCSCPPVAGCSAAQVTWATSEPVADAGRVWQALTDIRADTGLVPILLSFLDDGYEGRPWDERELGDRRDPVSADRFDPLRELAENWAIRVPDVDEEFAEVAEEIAPFGPSFPGLAPGQSQALTDEEISRSLDRFGQARIGLVPASRPADVLALVGHNLATRQASPEPFTAVLRSWEDRFGAMIVEVGFAHIRILATRPPRTRRDTEAVAAELLAMCDEFWPIDSPGTVLWGVGEIADYITDIPIWSLWLD